MYQYRYIEVLLQKERNRMGVFSAIIRNLEGYCLNMKDIFINIDTYIEVLLQKEINMMGGILCNYKKLGGVLLEHERFIEWDT